MLNYFFFKKFRSIFGYVLYLVTLLKNKFHSNIFARIKYKAFKYIEVFKVKIQLTSHVNEKEY